MGLGIGELDPEPIAVVVPEAIDFGSPGRSRSGSRVREMDRGRGFSMSYRLAGKSSSSSSSSEARKSGSLSGSRECLRDSEPNARGALFDPLTIVSMSQNCRTFITMGKMPMTLQDGKYVNIAMIIEDRVRRDAQYDLGSITCAKERE